MKYCTNCGTPNDENTNFCSKCGQSLNKNINQVNYVPAAQVNGQVYYGKKKSRNGLSIASMVLGIIGAFYGFVVLVSQSEAEKSLREYLVDNNIRYSDYDSAKIAFGIGYALIPLVLGIIGLILGLVAKKNGKAIAGIITCSFSIIAAIIGFILVQNISL